MLYTASHIMDTESLSSAIQTETKKVRWAVPVSGLEKKLLYMGDTESLTI